MKWGCFRIAGAAWTRRLNCAVLGLSLMTSSALAAVWETIEVEDPLTGYKINVQEPVDVAEDIYNWPSKRDLVYFPHTDERWIWHSPHSDYVSLGDDFAELNDKEKERIRHFLKQNRLYVGKEITLEQKLVQMEAIYRLRDKDDKFWAWYYRLMAYWHRDQPEKARQYVQKALPLFEKHFAQEDEGIARIKLLYLMGEYRWRLGQKEWAKKLFARARRGVWLDQKGKAQSEGWTYINDLIQARLFAELIYLAEKEEREKKKSAALQKKQKQD